MTPQEWDDFIKWLQEAHQLSKMYTPDRYSIKLWEEYKDERTNRSTG